MIDRSALSRRRLLAASAALLATTATAYAQPLPQLLPPFGRPHDPNPAKPEPRVITEADWYVGSVPDGQFEIRKVNMELLAP